MMVPLEMTKPLAVRPDDTIMSVMVRSFAMMPAVAGVGSMQVRKAEPYVWLTARSVCTLVGAA